MFKRLWWMCIGIGFGFGFAFFVWRSLRDRMGRLAPDTIVHELSGALRALGSDLREAVGEGRAAMAEREAELRAELDRPARPVDGKSTTVPGLDDR